MATAIESQQLLLLLNWMSPAFPIGAYAYSHGLEWVIAEDLVTNEAQTKAWISDVITQGSGWNDAVIFANAMRGENVNELALALCSSHERYLETTQLGVAFIIASTHFLLCHPRTCSEEPQTSPALELGRRNESGDDNKRVAYPIAAALACNAMGIAPQHALLAFLQGFSNALISVAVRLVPLGQTAGLHIMRDLMPIIADVAARAERALLDDLGSRTIFSDIAAMKHETLQPRIFRT